MFRTALVASFLLLSTAAYAGNNKAPEPNKDMACMVGNWQGAGTLTMGKDKVPLKMTYSCKPVSADFGLVCDAVITGIPGVAEYRETDMWGINAADGSVHWFAVTSGGEAHDHHGKLGKNSFHGQYVGRRNGKKFVEKVSISFKDENHFGGSSQAYENGKPAERIQFNLVKANGRRASR